MLLALLILPLLPSNALTPGEVAETNTAKVCVVGYSTTVRHTSRFVKERAYQEYGITHHLLGEFEVDHRIPLELGGADTLWNLWPQSYKTQPWNAHLKDRLENELRRRVCVLHTMALPEAQRVFLGDWISAYGTYVRVSPKHAHRAKHRNRSPAR